jgi:hypothetical protein
MTTYILMLWTVVAMNRSYVKTDWRPIGEFYGQQLCENAAKELGVKPTEYRCVRAK